MRNFKETEIAGVFEFEMFNAQDNRGTFVKPYHKETLKKFGLTSSFDESFFSVNKKGVIRGMHFQHPPEAHAKIVYCSTGKLNDVLLDIRKESSTYGKCATIQLDAKKFNAIYMPIGIAHGFEVLEENTCMIYLTETMYSSEYEDGITYNSFNYNWHNNNPIISERDLSFGDFKNFKSPF